MSTYNQPSSVRMEQDRLYIPPPIFPPKVKTSILELNELTLTRFSSIVPLFSVSSFLNISVVGEMTDKGR